MTNSLLTRRLLLPNANTQYLSLWIPTLFLLSLLAFSTANAEPQPATDEDTALVDSVEALKNEILKLNRDLFILEEDLLFPASTQTAVFLSIDGSGLFQLDSAKIAIDKKPVGHHLYTEKELAALDRGAVQRLYTGNVSNGKHELVIVLSGIGPKGRDYKRAAQLEFEKGTAAQYIELKIEGNENNLQPDFNFKVWQ